MPVERCNRCERQIDLDWDHIEYLNDEPVCEPCLTDDELEALDGKATALADAKKAGSQ